MLPDGGATDMTGDERKVVKNPNQTPNKQEPVSAWHFSAAGQVTSI